MMIEEYFDNQSDQPKIYIKHSLLENILESFALIGVVINFILIAKYWMIIPYDIPIHFGILGIADEWGDKSVLLTLPIISFGVYALLSFLGQFPHKFNYVGVITKDNAKIHYQNARTLLICIKAEIIFVFNFIERKTIDISLENSQGLGKFFLVIFVVVVFGTCAYYLYQSLRVK